MFSAKKSGDECVDIDECFRIGLPFIDYDSKYPIRYIFDRIYQSKLVYRALTVMKMLARKTQLVPIPMEVSLANVSMVS